VQIIYVARGIESIRANLGRSLTKDEGVIVSTVNAVERIKGLGVYCMVVLCPNWQQLFTECKPELKTEFMAQLALCQRNGTLIVKFVEFM